MRCHLPSRFWNPPAASVVVVVLLALSVAAEAGAEAEESGGLLESAEDSWQPTFGVGFDVFVQSLSASFESDEVPVLGERYVVPGPTPRDDEIRADCCLPFDQPYPDPANPGAPPTPANSVSTAASESVTPPMISLELGVTGPRLGDSSWAPRPFFRFRGQLPSKGLRSVGRENSPITKVSAQVEYRGSFFVGGGMDVILPIESRRFGMRVALDYFRIEVAPKVDVQLYERVVEDAPFYNELVFSGSGSGSGSYQGLAPSIDLHAFLGRRGQFGFSLYTEAQVLIALGNQSSSVTVDNTIAEGQGHYTLIGDSLAYQVGFGMRISWFGAKK